MRATEFIIEAPIVDYVPLGFDKKGTQFNPVDKKLVQHPVNKLKAIKFFEKTPYDFRLFFNDSPGLRKYREHGTMNPAEIRNLFNKEQADLIINGHDDTITIVFIGNYGDRAVMMTPWIMAHRFGHAIQAGVRQTYGGNQGSTDPWQKAEQYFFKYVNNTLEKYYGKMKSNQYSGSVNWNMKIGRAHV